MRMAEKIEKKKFIQISKKLDSTAAASYENALRMGKLKGNDQN